MKDFKFYLLFCLALALGATTMVSCGGDDDDDENQEQPQRPDRNGEDPNNSGGGNSSGGGGSQEQSQCWTEPSNILLMSDGLAFNWSYGSETQYYYWDVFTQSDYNRMSEQEVYNKVVTGSSDDRQTPDYEDFACVYNCDESTQFVIVTVSFGSRNSQGETVVTPMSTKTSKNQPRASIGTYKYYTDSSKNYYYGWESTKNNYCKQYYTYAVAGPDNFYAYWLLSEGYTPMLAWLFRNEITKNGEDHSTSINTSYGWDFTGGRDQFFGAQVESGVSYLRAFKTIDKYFLVTTWGVGANDELSGVISYRGWNLSSSSAPMNTFESGYARTAGEPQKANFKVSDFQVTRID